MRVYELAKQLGKGSDEVLSVLAAAGIEAAAPASGISDDEADQVRAYYADQAGGDEGATGSSAVGSKADSEAAAGGGQDGKKPKKQKENAPTGGAEEYAVLVGKGKIFCGAVLALKGDAVTKEQYDSLTERVQGYFAPIVGAEKQEA